MKTNPIKTTVILTATTVLLIILAPVVILLSMQSVTYDRQASIEGTYNLYGENIAVQEIVSDRDNLHKIGLSIKNPFLANKEQVILEIVDSSGSIIRTSQLNGINIADGSFVEFSFEPIANSKNQRYFLRFRSPTTDQEQSLGLFMTSNDVPWLGELMVNGEKRDTRIAVVGYYQPQDKMDFVLSVITGFLSKLTYDLLFLGSYLVIIFVLISKLVSLKRN